MQPAQLEKSESEFFGLRNKRARSPEPVVCQLLILAEHTQLTLTQLTSGIRERESRLRTLRQNQGGVIPFR